MAIENLPLWPFAPNWSSSLTETLEWLTDVMTSPIGAEQRRSLRYFPRRSFEYTLIVGDQERRLFDNLLTAFGDQHWYLPLWHDVNFVQQPAAIGDRSIKCTTARGSKILPGCVIALLGATPFENELAQVQSVTTTGIVLVDALTKAWPADTEMHPVTIAWLAEQPELTKQSNGVVSGDVRFRMVEANRDDGLLEGSTGLSSYLGYPVLAMPPEENTALSAGIERMFAELDNQRSIPVRKDTAARPFTYQQYTWLLAGRAELSAFEFLLQALRGRAQPLWVPTFMDDMRLGTSTAANAGSIAVELCGFVRAGGPRPDRQDIMIETLGGVYFRRITNAFINSQGREVLSLSAPIPDPILVTDVVRISFMTLMRLNQDTVVIEHETDTDGMATCKVTLRSAPDIRNPITASF